MASSFNSSCIKLLLQAKFHRWRLRVRSTLSANAKPPAFDLRKPGQDDSPQLVDGVLQIIIDYLIIIFPCPSKFSPRSSQPTLDFLLRLGMTVAQTFLEGCQGGG